MSATMRFTNALFAATCNDASRLTDTTTAASAGPYGETSRQKADIDQSSVGNQAVGLVPVPTIASPPKSDWT